MAECSVYICSSFLDPQREGLSLFTGETAQAKGQALPQITQPQTEGQVSGPGSLILTIFPQSVCALVGLLKQNYFL